MHRRSRLVSIGLIVLHVSGGLLALAALVIALLLRLLLQLLMSRMPRFSLPAVAPIRA